MILCVECNDKEVWSKGLCRNCYQKWYYKNGIKGAGVDRKTRTPISDNCLTCNLDFGSIKDNGKRVVRQSNSQCKTCYHQKYKLLLKDTCDGCGAKFSKVSSKKFCSYCVKEDNKGEGKSGISMTKKQRELIRRLLVRYKLSMNTLIDDFRLTDIYLQVYHPDFDLDTYDEKSQVIIMLKTIKKLYDAPFIEVKEKLTDNLKDYNKKYRQKNKAYFSAKKKDHYDSENPEKRRNYHAEWRAKNVDKIEAYKAKARKKYKDEN